MKILPSYKNEMKFIKGAIKNCKYFFGENICYDVALLKSIKNKFEVFLEFLKNSGKTEMQKMVVSCGGTKNLVKISAIKETKLYKDTLSFFCDLDIIIKLMEVNVIKSTKGFDFTLQQIDNTLVNIYPKIILKD